MTFGILLPRFRNRQFQGSQKRLLDFWSRFRNKFPRKTKRDYWGFSVELQEQEIPKFFKYERGVQQGNPLSPLLFNLFINDIFDILKQDNSLLTLDNETTFNSLMYADDLIIMSETPEGLQKSLHALHSYCQKWKLSIN